MLHAFPISVTEETLPAAAAIIGNASTTYNEPENEREAHKPSDDETILYDEPPDDETIQYDDKEEPYITASGRVVKKKRPMALTI